MKTTQRHLPAITALLLISTLISFAPSSHAQSDPGLQTVAPGDVPADATFFLLSDYLINDSSLPAPYPFNPATNGVVYSLTSNSFIVDDTALADDADALDAMALLLQSQDQSSGNLFSGMTMMTMDSGLSGYSPMFGSSYTFDTN